MIFHFELVQNPFLLFSFFSECSFLFMFFFSSLPLSSFHQSIIYNILNVIPIIIYVIHICSLSVLCPIVFIIYLCSVSTELCTSFFWFFYVLGSKKNQSLSRHSKWTALPRVLGFETSSCQLVLCASCGFLLFVWEENEMNVTNVMESSCGSTIIVQFFKLYIISIE